MLELLYLVSGLFAFLKERPVKVESQYSVANWLERMKKTYTSFITRSVHWKSKGILSEELE